MEITRAHSPPFEEVVHMQIALVTGSSAGIGQATARQLAKQGLGVITTYRSHKSEGEQTVAKIEAEGGSAVALPLDLAAVSGIDEFVAQVKVEMASRWDASEVNYLVNNAGVGGPAMFADITEETFDHFHNVLFKGPYFLTQRLLPVLADGGAIVNTGSTAALPNRVNPATPPTPRRRARYTPSPHSGRKSLLSAESASTASRRELRGHELPTTPSRRCPKCFRPSARRSLWDGR